MFPELNRERLRFLFGSGISRPSLKRFLDQRKPALEMRGAQYRKRGKGPEADLNFLINLPEKCVSTVRAWCVGEIKATVSLLPEALVAQFVALERNGEELSTEQAAQFAGEGLKLLFSVPPPDVWIDFLKREIRRGDEEELETEASARDAIEVQSVESPRTGVESIILPILQRLRTYDGAGARELIASLPASEVKDELAGLVQKLRSRPRDTSATASEMRSLPSAQDLDPEKIPVLLRRRREARGDQPIFLEIRGVMLEGGLYRLSEEQVLELFESHEVMAFPDEKSIRPPAVGELAMWYVARYPTDRANKFRLRKPAGSLFTVVELSAGKDDFDQVRTAIQQSVVDPTVRPIFHLADGGFVRSRVDAPHVKIDFEKPLDYYQSVPVWDLQGTAMVVAPLPPADGAYDCADLSVITARVLKESEARRHLPEMTGSQISELIESLRASDMGLTDQRIARIGREFERYITSADRLHEVAGRVLESESVKSRISAAIDLAVSDALQQNQQLREERTRLERDISELKARKTTLTSENRQIGEDVRTVVRKSFQRAKEAGVKSLGELAVFASLLGSSRAESSEDIGRTCLRSWEAARVEDRSAPLIEAGVSIANSRIIATASKSIAGAGLPLIVVGPRASQIAVAIGRGLAGARCVVADVSVGATDPSLTDSLLESIQTNDCLVLRNYNLSAVEAYGSRLLDLLVKSATSDSNRSAAFIFSAARGPAALPLEDEVHSLAVVIDSMLDYSKEAADFDATLEQLEEDRSATRMRSLALARMLKKISAAELQETLAVISSRRNDAASPPGGE